MIPLSEPNLTGNEARYVAECVAKGWVSTAGEFVTSLENAIASTVGSRYAVATTSGTAALHTALMVTGLSRGQEVLVPTVTFIAPINAVNYCGALPVFFDCDELYNIDIEAVLVFLETRCETRDGAVYNRASGRRVWGVLPVHIFGNPVDVEALRAICDRFGLVMIEDASESLGSTLRGKHTGTFGAAGCFSFNGNKLITTGGGGMIVTDDESLARKAKYLTTQAKDDSLAYVHHEVGYNYRLTNIQAALGVAQMERLEEFVRAKRDNYVEYERAIADIPGLRLGSIPKEARPNFWFYPLRVNAAEYGRTANELISFLRGEGIESRPLWHLNHLQRPYEHCEAFSIERAYRLLEETVCIPCSSGLTRPQLETVVAALRKGQR